MRARARARIFGGALVRASRSAHLEEHVALVLERGQLLHGAHVRRERGVRPATRREFAVSIFLDSWGQNQPA